MFNNNLRRNRLAASLAATFLLFVIASPSAFGQAVDPAAAQAALVSEYDVNGLKVLVKRRPGSQTVAAGLFIRGGARNLTKETAGLENFMLNTATEGGKRFPREALRRELARTGSSVGSGSNNDFSVIAVSTTLAAFDRSWDVFTDVAINPAFDAADIGLTRDKLLTSLRSEADEPDSFLSLLSQRTIFAGTSYEPDIDGTLETVSKFTAADLRRHHERIMQTSQLLLVVVGDVDAVSLRTKIAATFGKLPRGDYKEPPLPKLDFSRATLDITSRPLPTNYVKGIFPAPPPGHPDHAAMRVATTLLRDRVFEIVRVRENLSYAPNADMSAFASNVGEIYVTAVNANRAIMLMKQEMDRLKNNLVAPTEISGVAGQFLTTYYVGQETNAAQARELALYELIGGGWRRSTRVLTDVQQLTPEDIRNVSRKYFDPIRFVIIGDPTKIDRSIFLPK
jgi:zinc protease